MKLITDCPECGKKITIDQDFYKGWLFCDSCQCIFFSHDSLRKNWPSLYEALEKKKAASKSFSAI